MPDNDPAQTAGDGTSASATTSGVATTAGTQLAGLPPASPGWPGPGWPCVQPSVTLEVHGTRGGTMYSPGVLFDQSGTRAVVYEPEFQFWTLNNLKWHAPDIAAVVLLIAIGWLLRRIYATIRARCDNHIIGHWYCRKCDYDLTPKEADLSSRLRPAGLTPICSECGVPTAQRPPRRAVGHATRLFPPIVALLLIGGGAGLVFDWCLQVGSPALSVDSYWPSGLASRVLSEYLFIPVLQRTQYGWFAPDAQTLSVYELPSGRLLSREMIPSPGGGWQITADGHWYTGFSIDADGSTLDVIAMNIRDGESRVLHIALPDNGNFLITSDQPDPHELRFQEVARGDGQRWALAGPSGLLRPTRDVSFRLWSLDLDSHKWTRLLEIPRQFEGRGMFFSPYFACWADAHPSSPGTYTAVIQRNRPSTSAKFTDLEILSIAGTSIRLMPLHIPDTYMITSKPDPGRMTMQLTHTQTSGWSFSAATLDLGTGAVTPNPIKPWSIQTPDQLLTFVYPAMPPRFLDPQGKVAAVLCIGGGACYPTIDPAGHWAWSSQQGQWPPNWLVDAFGYRFRRKDHIVLWDLEAIKKPIRAANEAGASPPS